MRVYIASAIANGHTATPRQIYKNVRYAETYYEALIKAGFTPIFPHLSYYAWLNFEDEVHWERWMEMDMDLLDTTDVLIRLPNESIGADVEVDYARSNAIEVVFVSSPKDTIRILEDLYGKQKPRPELAKFTELIKERKKY